MRPDSKPCVLGTVGAASSPRWAAPVAAGTPLLRIICALFLLAPHALAIDNADCLVCHSDPALVKTNAAGKAVSLFVDEEKFAGSVHGKLQCASCHADISEVPHPDGFAAKAVNCAQCHKEQSTSYGASVHGLARAAGNLNAATCVSCHGVHNVLSHLDPAAPLHRKNLAATCSHCHPKEAADYGKSIHARDLAAGVREAPTCTDCHFEHKIERLTGASPVKIAEQICGQCHASERVGVKFSLPADRIRTYLDSYHGRAARLGSTRAANCASCHGWHDVLPSSDPESWVNPKNLPRTCGNCHPGIGAKLAATPIRIHAPPGAAEGKPWIVNFVARFYIAIIVVIVGAMLVHNGLDYLAKTRAHARRVCATDGEMRLTLSMRAQHHALIVLFALLAYTGFVHKFPEAVWSWPFQILPDGSYWRGMTHRVSGWLFTGLLVGHLIALIGSRRGREELKDLWLRKHDWRDARLAVTHNLGRAAELPPHRRYNYVEKTGYWALMWGSVVMIITGVMLIFTEPVLRLLPKVWLDVAQVIHFYEALLATLAIILWHVYAVIFDPHVYPMNPAWLIGKKAPEQPTDTQEQTRPQPVRTPEPDAETPPRQDVEEG